MRAAKRAIVRGMWSRSSRAVAMDVEHAEYETIINTQDRLEALQAFTERRTPKFKGE